MTGGSPENPKTIGSALEDLESSLFVDREQELAIFDSWLADLGAVPVLNVIGRGGMGKSALLAAFSRCARDRGREVTWVNAEELPSTPEGFLDGLFGGTDPVAYMNIRHPVLIIDSFTTVSWLTRALQSELLPHLERGAKIVIAGRLPLGAAWTRWRALIRSITLDVLPASYARTYLERRGLTDRRTIDQIIDATAGHPLALALAADVIGELGAVDLGAVTEWRLVVRSIVEHLLNDVADPVLVQLLEAGAIVRSFDESTLAAVTGLTDMREPFARLCSLSVVRAGERGLTLHDDVRRVLVDDLRWRNVERYRELRGRALEYLKDRMSSAPHDERAWLWAERIFLWENAFVHSMLFSPTSAGEALVTLAAAEDADEVLQFERQEIAEGSDSTFKGLDEPVLEGVLSWMRHALELPEARIALARDLEGRMTGYTLILPLTTRSNSLLHESAIHSQAIGSVPKEHVVPRENADEADAFYIVRLCVGRQHREATNAALLRDVVSLFAREGTFVSPAALPEHHNLLESLGFEPMGPPPGPEQPFRAYLLDLGRVGFERWVEAVTAGRQLPRLPSTDELETELAGVFAAWDDDEILASSSLSALARGPGADAVRALLREAVEGLRSGRPDLDQAVHALDLAYLQKVASHERVAERLHVSRSTFYRLIRKAVRAVADAVTTGPR